MHPHQQAAAWADGGLVVAGVGAVGGADLTQFHPRAGHDVGDAESAADLDQLASGDDAFLARPQAVERQQYGRGVVVDHGDGFGAGQLADQALDQVVTVAALACGEVEFKVQRIARCSLHGFDGLFRQQRATQVGVQHGAGEVEHAAHLAALLAGQALAGAPQEDFGGQFGGAELATSSRLAQVVEQLPEGGEHGVAAVAVGQRMAGRVAQERVDGRQAWRIAGEAGRHAVLPWTDPLSGQLDAEV
ncbi:hypothetical protein D3C79_743160 [compost metagenome]